MFDPKPACRALFGAWWTASASSLAIAAHHFRPEPELIGWSTARWAEVLTRVWGVQVRTHGRDGIQSLGAAVYAANHQSFVDIAALYRALPVYPGFVAKEELARVPFLGPLMRRGDHIFIARTQRDKAARALVQAARRIRAGRSVVIFPEGTRSAAGTLGPYKEGAFRLAKQAKVPLVPVGIVGSAAVLPRGDWRVQRGDIDVHIGAPIPASTVKAASPAELAAMLRERTLALTGFVNAA
ncbi:MAG: lysophospholipid acyltransferase family protein [Polyangiales bacterium]